jgi:hypothetical protein
MVSLNKSRTNYATFKLYYYIFKRYLLPEKKYRAFQKDGPRFKIAKSLQPRTAHEWNSYHLKGRGI